MDPDSYRSFRDLPSLAGVATFSEAMGPGLSIDACVGRLKRHHWAFRRLHQIFIDRLTAEPIYELKMGFSLHAHYCAEHAAAWRRRIAEMREPPLGLDVAPHAAIEVFFDEILAAPDTESLLLGIYGCAVPALRGAIERHLGETNKLVDHPSVRICRFALLEIREMEDYGTRCIAQLVSTEKRAALQGWTDLLRRLLRQAGGLAGAEPVEAGVQERQFSRKPHPYDGVPRRDERFPDPYNMGVHAEVFLYDDKFPPGPKTLMMYYKRLREIDVPEMMASIIAETADKPWEYYVDMTRQLWDEARHAMMGEVGFIRAGIDWRELVRVNFTWSLALNTQLKPLERHAVLYFIEQGLMPKTGKRHEWEVATTADNALSSTFQDFDWADEVLHARVGRDWYVSQMSSPSEALEYGDKCWTKVTINWKAFKDEGLTEHRNWWPDLYRTYCEHFGKQPDPEALAFHETYEHARADLKAISASA